MSDIGLISQNLIHRLNDLKGKKVVIFGDIGIDEYVRGDVVRISPEAPVPVVEVKATEQKLGLSANVAANVKSLGGIPILFSLIGKDDTSEQLKKLLLEQDITTDFLMVDANRSTTKKLRIMTGQHHIVRVDFEDKNSITPQFFSSYFKQIESAIQSCDCIIIQDYAKGLITEDSCQKVIQLANKYNKKVLVDPYRNTPLKYYHGATFMTPNRDEAFELAKQIPKPEIWKDIDAIGKEFMSHLESPNMVITLGAEGMKIFEQNNSFQLPTFARVVFDVTGAGDTVIAAFALGMAAEWDLKTSGVFANLAAGVVVAQVGAVACTIDEIKNSLHN